MKTIGSVPDNNIFVTAEVVGLYLNVLHQTGLKAFKLSLGKRDIEGISTEYLVEMRGFVLYLSSIRCIIKSQVQQQKLNLYPLMHASTWIRLNK